eukprot:1581026-Pleurochrysis_carterae.AAC.1
MQEAEENTFARHHAALEKLADERANMSKAKEVLKEVEGMQKRKPLQLKHDGKTMKELTDELKSQTKVVRELMNAVDMLREVAFEAKSRAGMARLRRDSAQKAYSECLAASTAARALATASSPSAAPAAATAAATSATSVTS